MSTAEGVAVAPTMIVLLVPSVICAKLLLLAARVEIVTVLTPPVAVKLVRNGVAI